MKKKAVQVQTDEVFYNALAKRCFNKAKRCDSVTARGGLRELGRQYLELAKKVADVAEVVAVAEALAVADVVAAADVANAADHADRAAA